MIGPVTRHPLCSPDRSFVRHRLCERPRFSAPGKTRDPGFWGARSGRRYYNPSTGRWLSRDPSGEKGGANLYGFARNNAVDRVDALGLRCASEYAIPPKLLEAMETAWGQSSVQEADGTVEIGGLLYSQDGATAIATRRGIPGRGGVTLPDPPDGAVALAEFHTHPYPSPSSFGATFSSQDIWKWHLESRDGRDLLVMSGTCVFVLTDKSGCRKQCTQEEISRRWSAGFAPYVKALGKDRGNVKGEWQKALEQAAIEAIKGCGLCYYKVCRGDVAAQFPGQPRLVYEDK